MNEIFDEVKRITYEPPMTNADRIRAMSDEELAAMLDAFCEAAECRTADGAVCPFYSDCPHDMDVCMGPPWKVWLKQPYTGGAEIARSNL